MSSLRNGRALAACFGGMMCVAIGANLLPVFLTSFSAELGGLSSEQLGRISAIMFIGFVAGILIGGPLADRFAPRLFVIGGAAITITGLLLLASAHGYAALLGASALLGFGAGVLDMVLSPIVSALEPHRRTFALNWLHAFYCIGAVGTVLAGSLALRMGIPWRTLTATLTILPFFVGAAFIRLPLPPLVHETAERIPVRDLLRSQAFPAGLTVLFLAGAAEQGIVQWLPAYAELNLHYSKATGSIALALFSVGMASGRAGAASLVRHWGAPAVVRLACASLIVCCLAAAYLPSPGAALVASVLAGLAVSALWPTTLGMTADHIPHGGASMFALLAGAGNSGCIVMPWVIGLVAGWAGLNNALAMAAFCPLLILVLLRVLVRAHGIQGQTSNSGSNAR